VLNKVLKMASIENIIDTFIEEHALDTDEMKEPIIDLVNKCIEGIFKHIFSEKIPEQSAPAKTKTQKVLKADKIEDPTTVESKDELNNCTTGVLNQFCKDNEIKVGGNKAVLVDRVWRFLQGELSDDDKSSRTKPKTSKKGAEQHQCCGENAKGLPCGVAASKEHNEMWFCWRHITEADEIIAAKGGKSETKSETKAGAKAEAKAEAKAKPTNSKKKTKKVEEELVEEENQ
jgi:hypothetical protein